MAIRSLSAGAVSGVLSLRPGVSLLLGAALSIAFAGNLAAAELVDEEPAAAETPAPKLSAAAPIPQGQAAAQMGVQGIAVLAAQAYQQKDYQRYVTLLQQLVKLRPFNGQFRYRLAGGYALLDKKPEAFTELVNLQTQGLSYDPAADADFDALTNTEAFDYIADSLKSNGEPFGEADIALTLERDDLLSESVTFDPVSKRYLVGSVRYGEVIQVDEQGKATTFIKADEDNGLSGVFDLKVDSGRRHLWVASASIPHFRGYGFANTGETGLFKFDLDSGELISKVMLTNDGRPHLLGNMALAANGDVYVTDSRMPVVYVLRAAAQEFEPVLANPSLTSLRGITLARDDSMLYISDYDLGIFGTDLASQESFGLRLRVSLNLAGIDGLYAWGNHLVAIQSGISPQRIMRFDLSDDGREIQQAQPLLSNHASFDAPTLGVIVDDKLVFIANSQWGAFGGRGEIIDPGELKPLVVLSTGVGMGLEDNNTDGVPGKPN